MVAGDAVDDTFYGVGTAPCYILYVSRQRMLM